MDTNNTRSATPHRQAAKPRPPLFRALGKHEPPQVVTVSGDPNTRFVLADVLKHDSWAATAIYKAEPPDDPRKVIAKFNRQQAILVLPMKWLGRRLAARERWFMTVLSDVPHVPRDCGVVRDAAENGRVLDFCAAHWYIEGHPLRRDEPVNDTFFEKLEATLKAVHAHGIAYIDLHKRENIIVGEDGSPVLIDFQICQSLPRGFMGHVFPVPQIIRIFQQMDNYHILKHMLRVRPDLVPEDRRDLDKARPGFVRFCRAIGDPMRWARRKILTVVGVRGRSGSVKSEVAPEDAFRPGNEFVGNGRKK